MDEVTFDVKKGDKYTGSHINENKKGVTYYEKNNKRVER